MSKTRSNSSEPESPTKVLDEEGNVDSLVKQRILDSREAVNTNENILFTERVISPDVQVSRARATIAWGHSVRRYIRDAEVLLRNDRIPENEEYYNDVELGTMQLIPPDKDGYQFSLFASEKLDDKRLKKRLGLPFNCDPPKPKTFDFTGLLSILQAGDVVSHNWEVYTQKEGARGNWKVKRLEATQPIRKDIYDRAVRATDQFLQGAGIGIRTGMPEVDAEAEPW